MTGFTAWKGGVNENQSGRESGLTVKTVRYYANIGFVCPTIDTATGYRHYDSSDIAKLKLLVTPAIGFFGEHCRELALYEQDRPSRDVKKIAMNKIADIDRRLGELRRLKSELAALAHACDGDDRPNCPIIEGLAGTQRGGWSSRVLCAAITNQIDQKFEKFQMMLELLE